MAEPRFKPCMQDQPMLLPPDIGDLVPEGSMPRVVDMVVRPIDRSTLTSLYPDGGAPAHDPQMMLKVVLLAYASGVYSSRAIARATRENVGFLWVCGMRPLDHNTINRFRTERVRPVFEEVFSEVIQLLADMSLVTLDTYFLDGTKMEANANRFTFVWAKSTRRYKEQLGARVHAHLAAIDEMDDEEEALAPDEPAEVDSEAIAEAARRINERIARKGVGNRPKDDEGRALRRAKRMLEGEWAKRMARYEDQEETLGGRGSYSKTDPDASFMRMKEDTLTNQTKPGYNVQAGTEVEGAGHHHEIGADVAAEATTLAGVERLGRDVGAVVEGARHAAGVHAHLEAMRAVHLRKERCHARVVRCEDVARTPLPRRLVKQEDDRVDPLGKAIMFQALQRLVDGVVAQHVVDVGAHARLEEHPDGSVRVGAAIPAHCHSPAVAAAELGKLGREAVARGREVGHQQVLSADAQQLLEVRVLVGVASSTQRQLVAAPGALLADPAEALHRHVRLLHRETTLIAANARPHAEARLPVGAAAHDAHVDEVRKRRHEGVHTGIAALLVQDARAHVGTRPHVEGGAEAVALVLDHVPHARLPPCRSQCAMPMLVATHPRAGSRCASHLSCRCGHPDTSRQFGRPHPKRCRRMTRKRHASG